MSEKSGKRISKTDYVVFSPEEIQILQANTNVKSIRTNHIVFTYEFRCRMYDWYVSHHEIRKFLENNGISTKMINASSGLSENLDTPPMEMGVRFRILRRSFQKKKSSSSLTPECSSELMAASLFQKRSLKKR